MSKRTIRSLGTAILTATATLAVSASIPNAASASGVRSAASLAKEGYLATNPAWGKLTLVIGDNGGDGSQALAADTGIFKSASYKVSFAKFTYGPPLVEAAASGDISVGSVGDVPPITGAAQEFGFKIVAVERSLYPTQPDEDIIVPKGSPIHTLAELKGKTIAVPQGSSANGLVLLALKKAGLTPNEVSIDYLSPAAGATAYASGKVDAWAIWNPQLSIELGQGSRVLAKGLPPIDQTSSYEVASDKLLDNPVDKAALTNLLERDAYDFAWANKHPAKYAAAIAQEDGITIAEAKSDIQAEENTITPNKPTDIAAEQSLGTAFLTAGQITKKVNVSSITENILPAGFDSEKQLG